MSWCVWLRTLCSCQGWRASCTSIVGKCSRHADWLAGLCPDKLVHRVLTAYCNHDSRGKTAIVHAAQADICLKSLPDLPKTLKHRGPERHHDPASAVPRGRAETSIACTSQPARVVGIRAPRGWQNLRTASPVRIGVQRVGQRQRRGAPPPAPLPMAPARRRCRADAAAYVTRRRHPLWREQVILRTVYYATE